MLPGPVRSLLAEPPVADPPARVWRDWVVAALIIGGCLLEALLRDDVPWPWATLAFSVVLAASTLTRRTHRLPSLVVGLGAIWVMSISVWLFTDGVGGFYSMAWVLVVPYAVFRWGSGQECLSAVPVLLVAWVIGITTDPGTIGDAIGGLMVLAVTAGVGLEVRHLRSRRERAIHDVRLTERAELARELHDSVAHHVSAIAIQAQAGQAVAATRPEAAAEALAVIEQAASRTLAEMRTMVGALRNDADGAELAPQQGVADIAHLAAPSHAGPPVEVQMLGDLDDLRAPVDTALFRLAQESITNALRHATGATKVSVTVAGDHDCVHLAVVDDGRGAATRPGGYGVLGMQERAKLVGGVLTAGPAPDGGWRVDATLPREGATR